MYINQILIRDELFRTRTFVYFSADTFTVLNLNLSFTFTFAQWIGFVPNCWEQMKKNLIVFCQYIEKLTKRLFCHMFLIVQISGGSKYVD